MSSPTSATRRVWTSSEDRVLKSLVARHGTARGAHWRVVAQSLPGRTSKDCRKRWYHSLDPSLRKGRWTEEEDLALLDAYARLGPAWHDIALLIPGRKDDQCAKRYTAILDPSVKERLRDWNEAEDEILREGVQSLGHRWSAIATRLPGRPPLTCRNRWRNLSKQLSRQGIIPDSEGATSFASPSDHVLSTDDSLDNVSIPSSMNLDQIDINDFGEHEITSETTTSHWQGIRATDTEPVNVGAVDEFSLPGQPWSTAQILSTETTHPPIESALDYSTLNSRGTFEMTNQDAWYDASIATYQQHWSPPTGMGLGTLPTEGLGVTESTDPVQVVHHVHHHHHYHHYHHYGGESTG